LLRWEERPSGPDLIKTKIQLLLGGGEIDLLLRSPETIEVRENFSKKREKKSADKNGGKRRSEGDSAA